MNAIQRYSYLRFATFIGLAIHATTILISIPFFRLEPGTPIRPMNYGVLLVGLEACSIFICFVPAILSLTTAGHRLASITCGLVGITPFVTGVVMLVIAMEVRGLKLLH
ncbi:hypothetical protein DES53_12114 [Roseimicrobium gellanilyticum]|uniref:Uncharacterized protein n=1 Tax=Roseimicrobium gellanilyticum TaxID=748857 RepID=A0A366H1U6_9BACT|nr:hypothetical protein DES53_12114 [Roseimicrobium gellanilyticum]